MRAFIFGTLLQEKDMDQNETLHDNSTAQIAEDRTILDEKDIAQNATVLSISTHSSSVKSTKKLQEGEMFGDYRIETLLGCGGMGAVYKAFDTKLQRFVALKLILSQNLTSTQLQRFFQEAQATAKLEHGNIVKLYSTGETPQHHLVMEFIDGCTLSRQHTKSYREIAELCSQISQALHFAHEKGIIHRDIKPSNIMLTKDGVPKIMDFGLAKMTDIEQSLSNPGAILGTLAYMPVEQAEGRAVDQRSDVYSLGATLYDLLCRRPPFEGESHLNILHQIFNNDIINPTQLNPDIPRELEAICLKCLERSPDKRYASAKTLSEDLQNYLHHRPTIATPPNMFTYATKFIMRNKIVVLFLSFIFFIVSVAGIFSYVQWQKADVERKNAEEQRQKADAERKNAEEQRQKADVERKNAEEQRQKADAERKNANLHLAEIAKAKAEEIKKAALKNSNTTLWADIALLSGRGLEFILDQKPHHKKLRKQLKKLIQEAIVNYSLVWRQQCTALQVLVDNETIILFYSDGTIRYCDLYNGGEISQHTLKKLGKSAHFSRMKNGHIAISAKNEIMVWDYKAKKLFSAFSHNFTVADVTISDRFVAVHDGHQVQIFQKTGEKIHELTLRKQVHSVKGKGNSKFCDPVAISFVANDILRIDIDGTARDYSIKEQMFLAHEYATQTNKYKSFTSDNSFITITKDNKLTVRHFTGERLTHLPPVQLLSNSHMTLSDFDGKNVVLASENEIYVWKMERVFAQQQQRRARRSAYESATFRPQQQMQNTVQTNVVNSAENDRYKLQFICKIKASATSVAVNNGFLVAVDGEEVKAWSLDDHWSEKSSAYIKTSIPSEVQMLLTTSENRKTSSFDYRTDLIRGYYIEELLDSNPLQVVKEIFQHEIQKTLTTEPAVVSYRLLK